MAQVYAYHQQKVAFLRSNVYNVEVMWSCDWKNLRETDDQAQFVLLALNLQAPLKPKDAFKGGRTNGFRLFYERKADEKISHIDIVSLYPYVNKHCEYPIGHPKIIISNFSDIRSYFGFVRCVAECPDRDHFSALPVTIRSKLIFPCAIPV